MAASPSFLSPQCTNSQSQDEARNLTGNYKQPLRSSASYKAKTQNLEQSVRNIGFPSLASQESPRSHPALHGPKHHLATHTLSEKGLALQQPSLPAWGLGAPTPDCLLPHKHRPAHNRTLLPQTKAQTPILSPRVQRRSPSDAEMLGPSWVFTPSWACQRDPRPSPQRVAAEGFPLRYHLPQLTSPGGHGPGCLARSVSLL